jgi:hypothetical protein
MGPFFISLAVAGAFAVLLATVSVGIDSDAATVSSGSEPLRHTQPRPALDRNGTPPFNRMTASPVDPDIVYSEYNGLQVSRNGGATWSAMGNPPGKIIDLAPSATDVNTVYAATQKGLFISKDGGNTWKPLLDGQPVSMIEVTLDRIVYAFVVGRGVVRSVEDPLSFNDEGFDLDAFVWHWHVVADPNIREKP